MIDFSLNDGWLERLSGSGDHDKIDDLQQNIADSEVIFK